MFRDKNEIIDEFKKWKFNLSTFFDFSKELQDIENDQNLMTDAFYKDIEFGTGGIRGIMGIGTNRINIFTIIRVTKGVAAYIKKRCSSNNPTVAISYDSRLNSEKFARKAASIFVSFGIKVFIYPTLMPTPLLSWAVRELHCTMGIMITASHNPAEYNGYKVYGSDGCQITIETARGILKEIEKVDYFEPFGDVLFEQEIESGNISYIDNDIVDCFIEAVKEQSLLSGRNLNANQELSIVYTPLNGTGLLPVSRILKEMGFGKTFIVPEQKLPDGRFSTCPIPNPEEPEALKLGIKYAKSLSADIMIATDPDCDRVGVVAYNGVDSYITLSGNEIGILLLDYICKQRIENQSMPENPVFMKSIVTTELAEKIAEHYGVRTINLLTGFKFIGEQIGILDQEGHKEDFIFGFEESCGYLSGNYVRDKDGVGAAMLICEMAAYYKQRGKTLVDVLNEIYEVFGFYLSALYSYRFEGKDGFEKMGHLMETLRALKKSVIVDTDKSIEKKDNICKILKDVLYIEDYYLQCKYIKYKKVNFETDLSRANIVKFVFSNGESVIFRPSGTEAKLKVYLTAKGNTLGDAKINMNNKEIFLNYILDLK